MSTEIGSMICRRYNFDSVDISYMISKENFTFQSFVGFLQALNKYCVPKDSKEWSLYRCENILKKAEQKDGRANGSRRAQICNCCGKVVHMGNSKDKHES